MQLLSDSHDGKICGEKSHEIRQIYPLLVGVEASLLLQRQISMTSYEESCLAASVEYKKSRKFVILS